MKIKTLLALATAALALAACNKQPEPASDLSVNPTSFEFKAGEINVPQEFTVTSNAAWEATAPSDVDWFTVAEENGKGNGKFKVTVTKKNETEAVRKADVTVKAGDKTVTVTISQACATLAVEPDYLEFKEAAGEIQIINLTTNTEWTFENPGWIVVNPTNDGKLSVTSQINNKQELLEGDIIVKAGGRTATVKVVQRGAQPLDEKTKNIYTARQFVEEILLKNHTTVASRDTTYEIMNDLDFTYAEAAQYKGVFYANIDGNNHKINNWHGEGHMIQKGSSLMQNIEFSDNCTCHLTSNSGGMFLEANYGGKVLNIINRGTVIVDDTESDTMHRGMIMGINRAYVANCKNYGNAILNTPGGKQMRFGGILGSFAASQDSNAMEEVKGKTEVVDCENYGDITLNFGSGTAMQFIGGVVAFLEAKQAGLMTGCKNSGNITVVSTTPDALIYAGGLIGCRKGANKDNECVIKDCGNTGNVNGGGNTGGHFGGLLGWRYSAQSVAATMFENCTVNCSVTAGEPADEGANPCNNAGIIYGVNDENAKALVFGSENAPIKAAGKLICGSKEVTVNSGNLAAVATGKKSNNSNVTINAEVAIARR